MSVMSIRIDDEKRKLVKAFASLEGRTITEVVARLLDEYIERQRAQMGVSGREAEVQALMRLSEPAFSEWINEEDDVYDNL